MTPLITAHEPPRREKSLGKGTPDAEAKCGGKGKVQGNDVKGRVSWTSFASRITGRSKQVACTILRKGPNWDSPVFEALLSLRINAP